MRDLGEAHMQLIHEASFISNSLLKTIYFPSKEGLQKQMVHAGTLKGLQGCYYLIFHVQAGARLQLGRPEHPREEPRRETT